MDPDQTAPEEQSDLGPHCLPVCKNRFEKFARIFSRRHFQMQVFLGVLRVNSSLYVFFFFFFVVFFFFCCFFFVSI